MSIMQPEKNLSSYSALDILARTRYKQAGVLFGGVLLFCLLLWTLQIRNGAFDKFGWFPLVFLVPAAVAVGSWLVLSRRSVTGLVSVVEFIPAKERYRDALKGVLWVATLIIAAWLVLWINGAMPDAWWYPLPATSTILIYIAHVLVTDTRIALTEAGRVRAHELAEAKRQRQGALAKFLAKSSVHWWIRYPFAGLLLYAAYQIYLDSSARSGAWIMVAVTALYIARKVAAVIAVLALVCLIGWEIFGVVAALPVSVAVVIGAIIIAGAIKSK
jgi:hypothetical protein